MLTDNQKTLLAAGIAAETDAAVVAALAIRNDVFLTEWANANSTENAWHEQCSGLELREVTDVTKFDTLTAGKRDAWRLMLDFAPVDMRVNNNRKAVVDVWGTTDSVSILTKCNRKATNGETYIGGNNATTNTVTAIKLDFTGVIGNTELSQALNANGL